MRTRYTLVDGIAVPIISGGIDDGGDPEGLAGDPEHGGVTDDAFEAAAAAHFAPAPESGATDDDEPEPTGDETGGDTGDAAAEGDVEGVTPPPAAETPPEPNLDEAIEVVPGVSMTRREAAQWASFQQEMLDNPDLAQRVAAALRSGYGQSSDPSGQAPAPPVDQAPVVPEGIDLDDPAIAALWQQHVDDQARYAQLEQRLAQHDDYITNSQRQTTESLIGTARQTFQKTHNLTDSEMQQVYDLCGQLQVLPGLMSTTDPTTGLPRQVDPLAAMDRAFDIARWQIPELRQREFDAQLEQQKTDNKRKKKLSSLGGSSGSVPRIAEVPKTAAGRRQAMIEEVAGLMTGQGASE